LIAQPIIGALAAAPGAPQSLLSRRSDSEFRSLILMPRSSRSCSRPPRRPALTTVESSAVAPMGMWEVMDAILDVWSANRKLSRNGLRGSWLDWYR